MGRDWLESDLDLLLDPPGDGLKAVAECIVGLQIVGLCVYLFQEVVAGYRVLLRVGVLLLYV